MCCSLTFFSTFWMSFCPHILQRRTAAAFLAVSYNLQAREKLRSVSANTYQILTDEYLSSMGEYHTTYHCYRVICHFFPPESPTRSLLLMFANAIISPSYMYFLLWKYLHICTQQAQRVNEFWVQHLLATLRICQHECVHHTARCSDGAVRFNHFRGHSQEHRADFGKNFLGCGWQEHHER